MDTLARLENVSKIFPRVHRPGERLQIGAAQAQFEGNDRLKACNRLTAFRE